MIARAGYLRITMQATRNNTHRKDDKKMNKYEVNRFRKSLEARVIEIDHSTRRRDAIRIESSADDLDRILRASERELAVRSLEAASARRREARAALQRIQEGIYGICQECDEPIGTARLAALPWAALCIRCQEAADCRCAARSARTAFPLAA
jgi:DnaK suppressor protein